METINAILKLAAGIGLFLFALNLIEESLESISGRSFKLFLKRITKNKIGAVVGGILITAILQSSSMVSLMVLAFVGAGVFSLKNALAIILGANLGTTLASWLIAIIGFRSNIEIIAYPAVCVGGFMIFLFGKRQSYKQFSLFLLGLGLLLVGFLFMKTAMEVQVQYIDLSKYAAMPLVVFLFIGFIITVVIQSSSVTMVLGLTALHVGAITFPMAAAIVLGSETATTLKMIVATFGGNAAKKRVTLGTISFNLVTTIFAFLALKPILNFITELLQIKDPLIGLVTFSSLVNLAGIFIFLPILDFYVKILNFFYQDSDGASVAFIGNATEEEPKIALDLFRRETIYFLYLAMIFNLKLFKIETMSFEKKSDYKKINEKNSFLLKTKEEQYVFLKQLQGEIQSFYLGFRSKIKDEQQAELNQLIAAVRSAMHSVKSVKDIGSNILDLRHSSKDIKYNFYMNHKKETENLYLDLFALLALDKKVRFDHLHTFFDTIQNNFSNSLNNFYSEAHKTNIEDIDITTVINFNRELFTSNKAMLMAVKEIVLDEKEAENFNDIPIYRT